MTKEEIMNELEGLKKEYAEKMDNIHDVFDNNVLSVKNFSNKK